MGRVVKGFPSPTPGNIVSCKGKGGKKVGERRDGRGRGRGGEGFCGLWKIIGVLMIIMAHSRNGALGLEVHSVTDMAGLSGKVSALVYGDTNSDLMARGDVVRLRSSSDYHCSEGTQTDCADDKFMLRVEIGGVIMCERDYDICAIYGAMPPAGAVFRINVPSSQTLTLRSLRITGTAHNAHAGGIEVPNTAAGTIEIILCSFQNCEGPHGAISWMEPNAIMNIRGTSFISNTPYDIGHDENGGSITVHSSCPSPYEHISDGDLRPVKGETHIMWTLAFIRRHR